MAATAARWTACGCFASSRPASVALTRSKVSKVRRRMATVRASARGHGGLRNARNNQMAKRMRNERQSRGIKLDQGQFQVKAQVVRSRLARTSLDFGRARWMRGNAERMNGKAKGLHDRNTCFICDTDERGSGIRENLRLSSLNGRKNVEGAARGHYAEWGAPGNHRGHRGCRDWGKGWGSRGRSPSRSQMGFLVLITIARFAS